ncbi:lysozyme [Tepidimonas taiwanensis]|uniref:lysozyme n=1 Tax=Tepidimonas taiwanensis TaxID=307486 RepID=UPI0005BBBAE2|nr:lysozyme [Tepidimonas taiwanensis]
MKRQLIAGLGASAIAVGLIADFEGYRGRAYDDGVGVQTVGFGTTQIDGRPVRPGDTVTPERAVVQLARDADRIAQELAACIGPVPLYRHEWDAYVSWAYNVGSAAACRSTLTKKLKATLTPTLSPSERETLYADACRELLRWTRAGGRELPGLVKRRQAEYTQCIGGG